MTLKESFINPKVDHPSESREYNLCEFTLEMEPLDMSAETAKYNVGQVIHHTLFDYRGVIVDVDPEFRVGAELKAQEQRPVSNPKSTQSRPWYHVLVDGTADRTYVSEQNLEPDQNGAPVDHPDVVDYFERLTNKGYIHRTRKIN